MAGPAAETGRDAQADDLRDRVHTLTAELKRATDAKTAFAERISHEIRTPLNGILGLAAALSESELGAEQADMVRLIQSSGDTLLATLTDMLDLSRIEAGQMAMDHIPFDLIALIREVHAQAAALAHDKGLKCDLELGQGVRGVFLGDPTRLRQVIHNLLANAVTVTQTGAVCLSAGFDGIRLEVQVSDTGVAVPVSYAEQLFDPFLLAQGAVSHNTGGMGLGLPLSYKLCQLMGGGLQHGPNDPHGAIFTVSLPLQRSDSEGSVCTRQDQDCEQVLLARRWSVLAAEDNATNRKVLELLLKHYDLDLTITEDGAQLVAEYQRKQPDIILMDINMPVLCGVEAAARVRVFERARHLTPVPIIALSANAMAHQVARYLHQGIDAHLPKPLRREDLAAEMARFLRHQTE